MAKRDQSLLTQIETDLLSGVSLSSVLRKVIVLGGRADSNELRDWASRELNGYAGVDVPIPPYRRFGAQICIDVATVGGHMTGRPIGVSMLPDFVREKIDETVTVPNSIAEIESLIAGSDDSKPIRMPLPMAQDIAQYMDHEIGEPYQQITALYWAVSRPALAGVLDRIRTKLAELVGELIATMPDSQDAPTPEQAAAAVNLMVTGNRAKVSVANAQATGGGIATSTQTTPPESTDPSWWTLGHKIGAFVVGACVIAGTVIALLAYVK
ncbi:MAG: hypothetical protein ACR2LX_01575 [Jatrophihabitans sp.]